MGRDWEEGFDAVQNYLISFKFNFFYVQVKMSDHTLMKTIEMAITFGKQVLVENVGRELDPSLEPILLQ